MEFDGSDDYCAPQDWDIFRDAKSKTICFWSGGKHYLGKSINKEKGMNIIELSKVAKEGDKLKSSIYQNAVCVWKNGVVYSGGSQINLWPLLQSEWEIIPPEPKVLSAEELINGNNWESLHHSSLSLNDQVRRDLHNIAEMGRDNGKLEMWLEFKNYLDEKKYKTAFCHDPLSLRDAVKKLKPNQSPEN